MAIMSDAGRVEVHAQLNREIPGAIAVNKAELRAAVNAADQWVSDNAASFNAALPAAARNGLTAAQKAWLLSGVLAHRFNTEA